jgi:hypothetical protein
MKDRLTNRERPPQLRADRWPYVEAWIVGLAYTATLLGVVHAWMPW